jgi:hypothetical protein
MIHHGFNNGPGPAESRSGLSIVLAQNSNFARRAPARFSCEQPIIDTRRAPGKQRGRFDTCGTAD